MLVISDLVAGHQCAAHAAADLLPFSTASQIGNRPNATTAAGLPVHLSSRSNGRGGSGVNSCQRFLRVCNFDCEWRLVSTVGKCFTICALDICEMCQQVVNVRRA